VKASYCVSWPRQQTNWPIRPLSCRVRNLRYCELWGHDALSVGSVRIADCCTPVLEVAGRHQLRSVDNTLLCHRVLILAEHARAPSDLFSRWSSFVELFTGSSPWSNTEFRQFSRKLLVGPSVWLSTVSSRAFPVAAAQIWNSLPEHAVSAPTLQSFRRHLKTFLLQQSFCL